MHELPVINSILSVVLKHAEKHVVQKVKKVHLQVGELSDLEEKWMQHYFDYLSANTLAEGAVLQIEKIPVKLKCMDCENEFSPDSQGDSLPESEDTPALKKAKTVGRGCCPECGGENSVIIAGRNYYISNMEAV